MSTQLSLTHFDTEPELYDRLVMLFGEKTGESVDTPQHRWVQFTSGDVEITFFAKVEPALAAAVAS